MRTHLTSSTGSSPSSLFPSKQTVESSFSISLNMYQTAVFGWFLATIAVQALPFQSVQDQPRAIRLSKKGGGGGRPSAEFELHATDLLLHTEASVSKLHGIMKTYQLNTGKTDLIKARSSLSPRSRNSVRGTQHWYLRGIGKI